MRAKEIRTVGDISDQIFERGHEVCLVEHDKSVGT